MEAYYAPYGAPYGVAYLTRGKLQPAHFSRPDAQNPKPECARQPTANDRRNNPGRRPATDQHSCATSQTRADWLCTPYEYCCKPGCPGSRLARVGPVHRVIISAGALRKVPRTLGRDVMIPKQIIGNSYSSIHRPPLRAASSQRHIEFSTPTIAAILMHKHLGMLIPLSLQALHYRDLSR